MKDKYNDIPWLDLIKQGEDAMCSGATIYQKFTCDGCGARQTMDTPDTFYQEGQCEECQHVTDLVKKGGGFMAHFKIEGGP